MLRQQTQCKRESSDSSSASASSSARPSTKSLLTSKLNPPADVKKYSYPYPDGPYAVDHFQIGKDNVQLRTAERWRVDQFVDFADLNVDGVQIMEVDGIQYYGYYEDDFPVYLSYPLPLIINMYVPSTRKDKNKAFDYYDGDTTKFIGNLSLEMEILARGLTYYINEAGDIFFTDGEFKGYQAPEDITSHKNSIAQRIINLKLSEWVTLQGVYLVDDSTTDAYTRLVDVKNNLIADITTLQDAHSFLTKLMGSLGVPTSGPLLNSVPLAIRRKVYDLLITSYDVKVIKEWKTYVKRHAPKQTKGPNDTYNSTYDFSKIKMVNGTVPFIILAEPNDPTNCEHRSAQLASWGFAVANYQIAYNFINAHVPGKVRTVNQILASGNAFPDIIGKGTYFGDPDIGETLTQNYGLIADSTTNFQIGNIFSMGWNYGPNESHTGTSAYEFNHDIVLAVLETCSNALDNTGKVLSDYVRFQQMGVYGRSGGEMALSGAHSIEYENTGSFIVGVANDIVLSLPYSETGTQDGAGDFYGGYTEDITFPGGLNYPIMFMEDEVDYYDDGSLLNFDQRTVVGARKTLQNIIRKTDFLIRSKSMFLEMSQAGHQNQDDVQGVMTYGAGSPVIGFEGYPHPTEQKFPNRQYDPVWGFQDVEHLKGDINASTNLAICLYFRCLLSNWEDVRLNVFNYLPFKFDINPWDIPNADDTQWRKRQFSLDLGQKFNLRLDVDRVPLDMILEEDNVGPDYEGESSQGTLLYFAIDITDPETEVIEAILEWNSAFSNGQAGDLDIALYNPDGNTVQLSYINDPELIRFDISNIANKVGTWYIEFYHYYGEDADFRLRAWYGYYKMVLDKQYQTIEFDDNLPSHPELAVTKRGISMLNLPTSPVGLISGDLWDNAGVISRIP